MAATSCYETYRNNHYEGMDSKKLILMLYDGALKYLFLAKQAINEKNIAKRGENIGRVIAIVSELQACLDPTIKDESIDFLRSLYAAILAELPKVSLNNDVTILDRTHAYLSRLKEIWENNVMGNSYKGNVPSSTGKSNQVKEKQNIGVAIEKQSQGYGRASILGNRSISV